MAHGVCRTIQYASHAWASNSLCRSSQEEMGSQLSLYGTLCTAVIPCWILWAYKTSFGHGLLPFWLCHFLGLPNPTSFSPFNTIQKHNCSSSTTLLNGCHGLLPVCLHSCHCNAPCSVTSRLDEHKSCAGISTIMDHFLFHCCGI